MLKFKKLKLLRKEKNHLAILNLNKKAKLQVKLNKSIVKAKRKILAANKAANFRILKIKD
jgi:hypothetical protein